MKKSEIEVPVRFAARYSDTLSDDKFGRWGIVAYAGKFHNGPFHNGRVASWEIAWIKKLNDMETGLFTGKFIVHPSFPYHGLFLAESIEQAKKEIEKEFTWFVKMSLVLPLVQPRNKTLHKANVSESYFACDVCGCHPSVIIRTAFGAFCELHAKYVR